MANPYDQFDTPKTEAKPSGNPYDKFDAPTSNPRLDGDSKLNIGEKLVSMLPKGAQDWLSNPTIGGENIGKGSRAHGVGMGMADAPIGALQLATYANPIAHLLKQTTGIDALSSLNNAIDAKNADYEKARKDQGREGFDAARLVGNIASPTNAAVAAAVPIKAAGWLGRAAQGARAGAIGAASSPVENANESFIPEKLLQVATGAAGGALLTPVAGKIGDVAVKVKDKAKAAWNSAMNPEAAQAAAEVTNARLSMQADDLMREGVNRLKQEGIDLNTQHLNALRSQVMNALKDGKKLDVAALVRKDDFEALGIKPTLGQVTRDGSQFSREKNLRGVPGVGDPLLARFDEQSQKLQSLITGKSAGALDDSNAGEKIMGALRGVDDAESARIGEAYNKARDHLGRAAPMDSHAFSEKANNAINEQLLNDALPPQARSIMNKITTGEIPFNVNSAVMIDKRFSGIQRDLMASGNKEGALAIGKLRDALNDAPIADNVGQDAKATFDAARGMARERFKRLDAVPALKAASEGDVAAEDFVRKYLINGKVEHVRGLADTLPPEALNEAKKQFGAAIERAAFGQNINGDKAFSAESFAKFMNQPGMRQKLAAFYGPDEIEQLDRIMRVGSYMGSFPANHTVNTSNTAAAQSLIQRLPGVPQSLGLLMAAKDVAGRNMAVNSAMKAQVPAQKLGITEEQQALVSRLLGFGAAGAAGGLGSGMGNN